MTYEYAILHGENVTLPNQEQLDYLLGLFGTNYPRPDLGFLLSQQLYLATATDPDRKLLVGICSLGVTPSLLRQTGQINDMVVHPEHREQGIAEELCYALINKAFSLGLVYVELTVGDKRQAARSLYNKLGFTPPDTNYLRVYPPKLQKG